MASTEKPSAPNWVGVNQLSSDTLHVIRQLHRHGDGFITFAVGNEDGDWRGFSLRGDLLESQSNQIPFDLSKDSYVSINAAFRAKGRGATSRGLGFSDYQEAAMRYLCASYCDLDVSGELSEASAEAELKRMEAELIKLEKGRSIPPLSMFVRSGRGLWAVWFLCEREGQQIAKWAWPEAIEQHRRIQQAVNARLAPLGADKAVSNTARYLRLPESLNTKSEKSVEWFFRERTLYTLNQLEHAFDGKRTTGKRNSSANITRSPEDPQRLYKAIEALDRHLSETDEETEARRSVAVLKRHGYFAFIKGRLSDLVTLAKHRNHIRAGFRNNLVYLVALTLRSAGCDQAEALARVREFQKRAFKYRLTETETLNTIKSVYRDASKRKVTNLRIGEMLSITSSENSLLNGDYLGTKQRDAVSRKISDALRVRARQGAIREIVAALPTVPSTREMAKLLVERGFKVSYVIVAKDYKTLFLKT